MRSARAASWAVVPHYLLCTIALTWPLAREMGRALPMALGALDPLLQIFLMGWDLQALTLHPLTIFSPPVFYPEPRVLAYADHLIGEAVAGVPFAVVSGKLPVAYNGVVMLSFVLSAWALYRLARDLGVSRAGSWLAGFLYAFSPFRWCNLSNLTPLQMQFLPLGLLFVLRFARRGRIRDLGLAGLTLAVQSYFGWYFTFYLGLAYVLVLAIATARGMIRWREAGLGRVALVILGCGALVLPGLVPYLATQRAMPGFRRTLGMAALYSADLLDYLRLHAQSRLLGRMPWTGDRAYWPGLVTVVLALGGIGAMRKQRAGGLALVVGAASFVLSLGPVLHVAGHRLPVPLPYALLFYVVPGFASMRAPARLASLVLLALAAAAGFGFDRLRGRGSAPLLLAGLLAVALAEGFAAPIALTPYPDRASMPEVYEWLAHAPGNDPVLELPMPATEAQERDVDARRQFYLLYHRKPRIDGVSGFVPPRVRALRVAVQAFPAPAALRAAEASGARWVIVHYGDWPAAERAARRAAVARGEWHEAHASGDDVAYDLRSGRSF